MSKAVFDDTKVTDHHAIIPTEIPPSQNLSKEENLFMIGSPKIYCGILSGM